jgi:hypothetical protein
MHLEVMMLTNNKSSQGFGDYDPVPRCRDHSICPKVEDTTDDFISFSYARLSLDSLKQSLDVFTLCLFFDPRRLIPRFPIFYA